MRTARGVEVEESCHSFMLSNVPLAYRSRRTVALPATVNDDDDDVSDDDFNDAFFFILSADGCAALRRRCCRRFASSADLGE